MPNLLFSLSPFDCLTWMSETQVRAGGHRSYFPQQVVILEPGATLFVAPVRHRQGYVQQMDEGEVVPRWGRTIVFDGAARWLASAAALVAGASPRWPTFSWRAVTVIELIASNATLARCCLPTRAIKLQRAGRVPAAARAAVAEPRAWAKPSAPGAQRRCGD